MRTIGAPLTLALNEREAASLAERLPPAQRTQAQPAAPERAAEILRTYMAAGIQGFTFGNPNLSTPELIAAAGEVKKLLG
jgi:hypothetical protein